VKKGRIILDYLVDIRDQIDLIAKFLEDISSPDALKQDLKTAYAVTHAIEIMGEATKNLPQAFRRRHPDIPWRKMTGMRDKLVHEYFGVDLTVLWVTATEDVPQLAAPIRGIISAEERDRLI
jgi:uncharacterized protein with HEPN domain